MAPPMPGPGPDYGGQRPKEQTNAVLGFALSIASFFTCLLLAPFAVFFSLKGLKERDGQGMATAGLIIGIVQSASLALLVVYFAWLAIVVGGMGVALARFGSEAAEEARARAERKADEHGPDEHGQFERKIDCNSLDQAIELLQADSFISRDEGLAWILKESFPETRRQEVITAVAPQLKEFHNRDEAIEILEEHCHPEDGMIVSDAILSIESPADANETTHRAVRLLLQQENPSACLALQNHPDTTVRSLVRQWIKSEEISAERQIGVAVSDLSNESRRENALEMLAEGPVIESEREQVAQALIPLITEKRSRLHQKIKDVMQNWGATMEHLEPLLAIGDYESIGYIDDDRALDFLAREFADRDSSRQATEGLRVAGPRAEKYIWSALTKDYLLQTRAVDLLGDIGTEESVPHLLEIRDGILVRRIDDAISKIRAAKRTAIKD